MYINSQGTAEFFHNVFWGQRILTWQRNDTQENCQVGAWLLSAEQWSCTLKHHFPDAWYICIIHLSLHLCRLLALSPFSACLTLWQKQWLPAVMVCMCLGISGPSVGELWSNKKVRMIFFFFLKNTFQREEWRYSPSWLKWLLPIHNESEKKMLHIQVCLHDSLAFTGIVRVPRQCHVDPQKCENSWETSGKRQVWTCRREKRQGGSRLESLFPAVPPLPLCDGAVVAQPSPKNICAAARKLCCFWGQSVMHCLVGFFSFLFSSRPIHLSASWSWEHILCKKLSFREKSLFEEFSAYTHPCVWNCFTSVPSNT